MGYGKSGNADVSVRWKTPWKIVISAYEIRDPLINTGDYYIYTVIIHTGCKYLLSYKDRVKHSYFNCINTFLFLRFQGDEFRVESAFDAITKDLSAHFAGNFGLITMKSRMLSFPCNEKPKLYLPICNW